MRTNTAIKRDKEVLPRMTDGIIQKIFSEYINMEINAKKKGYERMHVNIEDMLSQLQQELIAEIKKNSSFLTYYKCKSLSLKQLIGDNQE